MTIRLAEDFSKEREEMSHGEIIYAKHLLAGIREEAAAGFPSVRGFACSVPNSRGDGGVHEKNPPIKAMRRMAGKLDKQFTAQNINPVGCADLLALTFFLCFLDYL